MQDGGGGVWNRSFTMCVWGGGGEEAGEESKQGPVAQLRDEVVESMKVAK